MSGNGRSNTPSAQSLRILNSRILTPGSFRIRQLTRQSSGRAVAGCWLGVNPAEVPTASVWRAVTICVAHLFESWPQTGATARSRDLKAPASPLSSSSSLRLESAQSAYGKHHDPLTLCWALWWRTASARRMRPPNQHACGLGWSGTHGVHAHLSLGPKRTPLRYFTMWRLCSVFLLQAQDRRQRAALRCASKCARACRQRAGCTASSPQPCSYQTATCGDAGLPAAAFLSLIITRVCCPRLTPAVSPPLP